MYCWDGPYTNLNVENDNVTHSNRFLVKIQFPSAEASGAITLTVFLSLLVQGQTRFGMGELGMSISAKLGLFWFWSIDARKWPAEQLEGHPPKSGRNEEKEQCFRPIV